MARLTNRSTGGRRSAIWPRPFLRIPSSSPGFGPDGGQVVQAQAQRVGHPPAQAPRHIACDELETPGA